MTNYLYLDNSIITQISYNPFDGIYMRKKKPNGWGENTIIYKEGKDNFSVYFDMRKRTHIICKNENNKLIYLIGRNSVWNKYSLLEYRDDIEILTFKMLEFKEQLHLFYTAKYNGDIILAHCVLGVNSKPTTIARLKEDNFFLHGSKVYYTDKNGVLGYQDFSDGNPNQFMELYKEGSMPYVYNDKGTNFTVWYSHNKIMLNDTEIFEDIYAQNPVLLRNENQLLLIWKSREFVRYLASFNDGITWSNVMRFVNPNKNIHLYYIQNDDEILHAYGVHSNSDLSIFGKNNIFAKYKNTSTPPSQNPSHNNDNIEFEKLKIMIELMKSEITNLKKQMKIMQQIIDDINKD